MSNVFYQGVFQRGVNTPCINARGAHPPGAAERDQGLFPALLVHEEMQHDSGRSEQGQPRLITHKSSHPHGTVMDLHGAWGTVRLAPPSRGTSGFCCGTDPLADLRLVALREDVDVGLEGTGVDHGFVSGGGGGKTYG